MSESEYRLEDRLRKENVETPHYNAVYLKWRKLVTGGCVVAVNEFAHALKEDWYPRLSYEEIAKEPLLQKEIRGRIIADWSVESSIDGLGWKRITIETSWEDWLYRPYSERKVPKTKERLQFEEYIDKITACAGDFSKILELLGNVPVIQQQEDPEPLGGHRERPKTPEELYRYALDGYAKIILALTGFKDIPGPNVNIENEILNPSDKVRLKLIKGLNDNDRAILIKVSSIVNQISGRFLRQARDIIKDEKKVER